GGLLEAARPAVDGRYCLGQSGKVGFLVDHPRTEQHQIVVVRSEAFKYPEQAGVIFAGKVVGGECGGLDALYIPGVEVLVTDQTKEVLVRLAGLGASDGGKVATRCHQGGGRAMLKSTVAVAHDHGHEYIPISRIQKRRPQGRRLEQRNLGLADFLDVGRDALEVEVRSEERRVGKEWRWA